MHRNAVLLEGAKMKNAKETDQWVWVVVQDPGGREQFLGQHDKLENVSYIPVFRSKEEAQQCFLNMVRRKNCKYEVQAIVFEDLAKDAAANGFMIFLLQENGEVLEKIHPSSGQSRTKEIDQSRKHERNKTLKKKKG
jgi:hypothetical protein